MRSISTLVGFALILFAGVIPASAAGVTDCMKIHHDKAKFVACVKAAIVVKSSHLYTGEYTRFPEAEFGKRFDPRDGTDQKWAAAVCKAQAPEIKDPLVHFDRFKTMAGNCCGYSFDTLACVGLK